MPINNPINQYNTIQNNCITALGDFEDQRVSEITIEKEQKNASNDEYIRNKDAIHQFQEIQSDYIKNKQIKETIQDDLNQEKTSDVYLSISKEAYRLLLISQEQNKEMAIAKYFEEENKNQVINNVKNIKGVIQDNIITENQNIEISKKNVNNQRAIFEYQIISEMIKKPLSENQNINSSVVDSNVEEQQRINDLFNYNESQNIDNPIL